MGLSIWLSYILAFFLALAVVCLIGFIVYIFGFQHFLKDLNGSFILSIGLLLLLNGTYLILYGGVPRSIPTVVPGVVTFLGASLTLQRLLLMIVAAVITLGLYILVHRTKLGLSLRAVAEDQEAAMLQGIPFRRVALRRLLFRPVHGHARHVCAGHCSAYCPSTGDFGSC